MFNVTVVNRENGGKYEIDKVIVNVSDIESFSYGCCRCRKKYEVYEYDITVKLKEKSKNVPVDFYFLDSDENILYHTVAFTNESGYAHLTLIAGVRDNSASGTYTTPQVLLDSKPVKVIVVAGTSQKTKEISYR